MKSVTFENVCVSYYIAGSISRAQEQGYEMPQDPDKAQKGQIGLVGGVIKRHRFYTEVQALDDVSFKLEAGDRLGLIGVNGSGKTTLLKTCAGHLSASSGTVDVVGESLGLLSIGGSVQQNLTGRKNVQLKALYYGVPRAELPEIVEEAKEISGLGEFFEMPVSTYSSGMSTRLTMSFLAMVDGDIIILDEWVGTGDATVNDKAGELQDRLLNSSSILMIASHSEGILLDWTDRLIWMHKGKIKRDGPTAEVLVEYQEFVREMQNA